jgi:hypothetical protein
LSLISQPGASSKEELPEFQMRAAVMKDAMRKYDTKHDLAIKAANWAMRDDPECVAAFQKMRTAREELELAARHEVPKARAAYTAAKAEWLRITTEVFDRTMADAGFPEMKEAAE